MSALFRKLLRDLMHMKGQVLAIALVVAAGVIEPFTTQAEFGE